MGDSCNDGGGGSDVGVGFGCSVDGGSIIGSDVAGGDAVCAVGSVVKIVVVEVMLELTIIVMVVVTLELMMVVMMVVGL